MEEKETKEINDFIESEEQKFDKGLIIYKKYKSEYNGYFDANKDAKKGSMPHNLLVQELKRIAFEQGMILNSEEAKKNSSLVLKSEDPNNAKKNNKSSKNEEKTD